MIKAFRVADIIISILWFISVIATLLVVMRFKNMRLMFAIKKVLFPIMITALLSLMHIMIKELICRYDDIEKSIEHIEDGE